MSIQFREKKDGSHDSHFYRANPYANQGYLPTPSLRNRKQPQFATQIPQGIEYFEPSSRKHFANIDKKSQIAQMHLLQTPERFPRENRLAVELQYDRNLNTIDIQGASANSKKNKALKNRIKAQEELLRRHAPIITPLLAIGASEEERRRKLAEQQVERLKSRQSQNKSIGYRKHQSERRLAPFQHYIRNPYIDMKDQQVEVDMTTLQKELKLRSKEEVQVSNFANPQIVTYDKQTRSSEERFNRYNQDEQNINQLNQSKSKAPLSNNLTPYLEEKLSNSSQIQPNSANSSRFNQEVQQYFDRERKNIQREMLRKQMRQINPTNLSYEGSSFVRNSSIFANLGKNLVIK